MKKLKDTLMSDDNQKQVIEDSVNLINEQVAALSGIGGVAVKTIFKMVKAIRSDVLEDLMTRLLPEFSEALQPFADKFAKSGSNDFGAFLTERKEEVVQALLSITDIRAERAENKVLRNGYQKLRKSAESHVTNAIPGIAAVVGKFTGK